MAIVPIGDIGRLGLGVKENGGITSQALLTSAEEGGSEDASEITATTTLELAETLGKQDSGSTTATTALDSESTGGAVTSSSITASGSLVSEDVPGVSESSAITSQTSLSSQETATEASQIRRAQMLALEGHPTVGITRTAGVSMRTAQVLEEEVGR